MRKSVLFLLVTAAVAILAISFTAAVPPPPPPPPSAVHFSGALSVRAGARWECKLVNPLPQPFPVRLELVDMNGNPTNFLNAVVPANGFVTLSEAAFGTSMRYCRGNYPIVFRGELSAVDATRQATAASILLRPVPSPV